jgi:hypothetical protein
MPDRNDPICSASPTSVTPFTSAAGSSRVKSDAASKKSFWASTLGPKLGLLLKCTLQNVFADRSAKEHQILKRLGMQKHECAIGELELKCRKLENKAMKEQHQWEWEWEQHEYCMMQM